jgi:S-adenosyl methyltransferase
VGKQPRQPAPQFDVTTPSVARMYDYYLGGKDNFEVDRAAVDRVAEVIPEIGDVALENRAFLRRAVRYMARQGIRQFIDIGSGLPTVGNTHEIAQQIAPDARVVYVDNDPVVLVHGRAILSADDNTTVVTADMREPGTVLDDPETRTLIDFDEPVGVLLIAMTHFLTMDERPPVMGELHGALAPGSYLAATHVTTEGKQAEAYKQIEAVYATTPTPIFFRGPADISLFFDGYDLVDPGLVTLERWRPDPSDPAPVTSWLYGGVGRRG